MRERSFMVGLIVMAIGLIIIGAVMGYAWVEMTAQAWNADPAVGIMMVGLGIAIVGLVAALCAMPPVSMAPPPPQIPDPPDWNTP